jgi:feruloyl esterase
MPKRALALAAAIVLAACGSDTDFAPSPVACSALSGMFIAGAQITSATVVAPAGGLPEYCSVSATAEAALNFELRMPTRWGGKVLFIGGAGFDGVILTPDTLRVGASVLSRGYATIATDSGHSGSPFDASWALNNPNAVENFAYLAWHRVLQPARAIIEAHYAAPIRRTYFEGGSSGGREALIAAQRWPDDFDGVIARAPALSFVALMLTANRVAQQMYASAEAWVSPAALNAFSQAVLESCDALDGLADGMVGNVDACRVDPAVVRCPPGGGSDCLTDAQIESVNAVFSAFPIDVPLAHGTVSHPGYPLSGAEAAGGGWPLWTTGFTFDNRSALLFTLQDQFVKYFVMQDPGFDSLQFAPAAAATRLNSLSMLLDATDADVSAFSERGGKLILWHGLADYAISANGTVAYYERLVAAAGGQERADEFVRFYASPGVDHTGTGNGAPLFDLLGALDAWVDEGIAPGDLVAYRREEDVEIAYRPLCRYPAFPRYDGSGDPRAAASFTCSRD